MYKKLTLTFLLLMHIPLSAIDLNATTMIINEAAAATLELQDEFNTLIDEVPTPQKLEVLEINKVNTLVNEAPRPKKIETFETNETIEPNNNFIKITNLIDTNNTIIVDSSCTESNQSILVNGLSISLDKNNTIADNGCTDSNLGTSAEGLVIFKTRIKPYCKINGDKFAKQYMQEDWDDIYHEKEFKMEVLKACPNMEERYKEKWTPHLYQFTIEYASDSDAIPEC